jgi:hypothetical protein
VLPLVNDYRLATCSTRSVIGRGTKALLLPRCHAAPCPPLPAMPFKLTEKHLLDFLTPCEDGEWGPFMDALDPQVRWWITDDEENPLTAAGVYVRLSLSIDCRQQANRPVPSGSRKSEYVPAFPRVE